jgi:quinol monooxygenase YgiN
MRWKNIGLLIAFTLLVCSCNNASQTKKAIEMDEIMIRIAELEIDSAYIDEYKTILKEEAKISITTEPGVIAIYPMYQKQSPFQIRILEIYANRNAYESHLKTAQFLKYKNSTLKMVKSLRLVEMEAIDKAVMHDLFRKLEQ